MELARGYELHGVQLLQLSRQDNESWLADGSLEKDKKLESDSLLKVSKIHLFHG